MHGIVVGLHHTIRDRVLLVKLITLHAIEVGLRHTHTIPCDMRCIADKDKVKDKDWTGDLGWGGWSWGWAFAFLCFVIVECAHGHAYAKQVRIMCVLSVPLLDQVSGVFDQFQR